MDIFLRQIARVAQFVRGIRTLRGRLYCILRVETLYRPCKGRIDKMTSAGEIEKCFRNNLELFTLKKHEAAKSGAWQYFSLLFENKALTAVR